jgi:endo-1,4-beta-xylanase
MNWGGLDAAYALAKDNGFPFHFHVLIWGAQQPGWIDDDTLTTADQLEEITEWFQEVANRYPNIDYLEVVNEPLPNHNPPDGTSGRANYKEALGGDGTTGWDWVVNAFQMARDIFPAETKLMINDFGILSSTSSTAQYLGIIRLLQSQDLIDIIGVQGHAFTTTAPTVTMIRNLDSLATTGLPIQVTELDIDGPSDAIQLQDYQRIFPALYEHPGVEGITLWGWRPGLWRSTANLVNNNGSERPALEWLRTYLDTVDVTVSIDNIANNLPKEFHLYNNYPNPFNPVTHINYDIAKAVRVNISIYDITGRLVETIVNDNQIPGRYSVTFDADKLSSGMYFYQIKAGSFSKVNRMLLIK